MNIHDIAAAGGRFADAASLREFRPEARGYEAIIDGVIGRQLVDS